MLCDSCPPTSGFGLLDPIFALLTRKNTGKGEFLFKILPILLSSLNILSPMVTMNMGIMFNSCTRPRRADLQRLSRERISEVFKPE